MYYEKPEIDILMFMDSDVITSSILDKDEINSGGDIDYDADGV